MHTIVPGTQLCLVFLISATVWRRCFLAQGVMTELCSSVERKKNLGPEGKRSQFGASGAVGRLFLTLDAGVPLASPWPPLSGALEEPVPRSPSTINPQPSNSISPIQQVFGSTTSCLTTQHIFIFSLKRITHSASQGLLLTTKQYVWGSIVKT